MANSSMTRRPTGTLVENVKTIVYAILIALGVRTIAFEPFTIPSGSMESTLLVGDYVFVSKYSYGYSHYSLPFSPALFSGRIFASEPKRGDVAVFRFPRDPSTDYIKRIVGLPGDTVPMKGGQLYLNGTLVSRRPVGESISTESQIRIAVRRFIETLPVEGEPAGREHIVQKMFDQGGLNDTQEFLVPPGHFFAMGDNRDNSSDSRDPFGGVGYVPMENLIGRAEFIWLSIDATDPWWQVWEWPFEVRWSRLFSRIR